MIGAIDGRRSGNHLDGDLSFEKPVQLGDMVAVERQRLGGIGRLSLLRLDEGQDLADGR